MQQAIWTFVLFWTIPLATGGDVRVTCVFTSDCVLPCKSMYHDIIKWYKDGTENAVHTFNNNKDHLEYQDAAFRGRTSLFTDQISQGNVSLLLRMVRVEDEGIYTCHTSSSFEDLEIIVWLDVKAPIKRVDIKFTDKEITCNTSKVYPKPIISWYEIPSLQTNITTETHKDDQGLFSLKSIFTYEQDEQSDTNRNQSVKQITIYTCSISFEDKSQTYTASLRQEKVDIYSGQDANIHCPVSRGDAGDYTITLRFGESSIILKPQLNNIPEQLAGINVHLAHDGKVTLHNLDMDKHTGTYICETFNAQSTIDVVQTSVQIISDIHNNGIAEVLGAVVVIMAIISLLIYYLWRRKGQKKRNKENSRENEVNEEVELEEPLSGENPSSDTGSDSDF
ncbi:CD276 antigen-like [Pangasianodon hypophthalmus]|uniref:CD276 antigen-like n=1 Tax=Pangasianodon hypophthalmus TaxID=310915 RepID=UPI002307C91B|nr:CD276 antigen-like [Pangasianodon hypophthalmus]